MNLTDCQRRALTIAAKKNSKATIGPRFRALAKTQVAPDTAGRLIAAGWLEQRKGFLVTTPAGKTELERPELEPLRYMHADSSRGYTDKASKSFDPASVVLTEPSETWKLTAQQAQAAAKTDTRKGRQDEARKVARIARISGRHGWRTHDAIHPVSTRIDETVIREGLKAA